MPTIVDAITHFTQKLFAIIPIEKLSYKATQQSFSDSPLTGKLEHYIPKSL